MCPSTLMILIPGFTSWTSIRVSAPTKNLTAPPSCSATARSTARARPPREMSAPTSHRCALSLRWYTVISPLLDFTTYGKTLRIPRSKLGLGLDPADDQSRPHFGALRSQHALSRRPDVADPQ